MKTILTTLLILLSGSFMTLKAQSVADDFSLISEKQDEHQDEVSSQSDRTSFSPAGRNAFERYNPVSLMLSASLYGYQSFISPQLGSNCIYHTSCSTFGQQAINTEGFAKGMIMTADRISRCNRIAGSDVPLHRIDTESGLIQDEPERY